MTLQQLSKALTSIYNTLGNEWITENFISEPFEFRVNVRMGDKPSDLYNIIVDVYTERPIPRFIPYKEGRVWADGIHHSVLSNKLKELANYIERFGEFGRTLGVNLVNLEND